MDGLDVRILRTIGIRPFRSTPCPPDVLKTGRIADAVGVTPDTVRARLARMEDQGVIAAYQVVPNLAQLGLSASAFLYLVDRSLDKDEVVARARAVDGMLEIHDFIGPGVCLDIAFQDTGERDEKLSALSELTGHLHPRLSYHRRTPEVSRPLSQLDWRIIRALRWEARRSPTEVASEVGVTARTVKRRRDRMLREGSLLIAPLFDPSRADGLLLFNLLVHLGPSPALGVKRGLIETFSESCIHALKPASTSIGAFNLVLCAHSSREVEALRQQALELQGIRKADVALFRGVHDTSDWLDDEIEHRAKGVQGRRQRSAVGNAERGSAGP